MLEDGKVALGCLLGLLCALAVYLLFYDDLTSLEGSWLQVAFGAILGSAISIFSTHFFYIQDLHRKRSQMLGSLRIKIACNLEICDLYATELRELSEGNSFIPGAPHLDVSKMSRFHGLYVGRTMETITPEEVSASLDYLPEEVAVSIFTLQMRSNHIASYYNSVVSERMEIFRAHGIRSSRLSGISGYQMVSDKDFESFNHELYKLELVGNSILEQADEMVEKLAEILEDLPELPNGK